MRVLEEIINGLETTRCSGNLERKVAKVCDSSRDVIPTSIFVAVRGTKVDGHDYIDDALKKGSSVIVAEERLREGVGDVCWIQVNNTREALSRIAANWYSNASKDIPLVGVTGTNGKTTVAWIIYSILKTLRIQAGLVGTIGIDCGKGIKRANKTTPSPIDIHSILSQMLVNECQGAAMEVSSHGLHQDRVSSIEFNCGVFTNLTQDHLDYHETMESYYLAKKKLFVQLEKQKGSAVINIDDPYGERLYKEFSERLKCIPYGFSKGSDLRVGRIIETTRGTEFQLEVNKNDYLVRSPFIGRFNIYNVLAALSALKALGVSWRAAITSLKEIPPVPGRMEKVAQYKGATIFIDYAHTPDALENVCRSIRDLRPSRLITVFGCGGDRDVKKRPLMGAAASRYSDRCYVTSDNPRSESPEGIIEDIIKGMRGALKVITTVDRSMAIKAAIDEAQKGDVILIAGKGHEDYQELADEVIPFSDRLEVRKTVEEACNVVEE